MTAEASGRLGGSARGSISVMPSPALAPVLDVARARVSTVLGELVQAGEQAAAERRAEPHRWAVFHLEMARRLPRWRWLARAWHRGQARRMASHARAQDIVARCSGERLAEALGLP